MVLSCYFYRSVLSEATNLANIVLRRYFDKPPFYHLYLTFVVYYDIKIVGYILVKMPSRLTSLINKKKDKI